MATSKRIGADEVSISIDGAGMDWSVHMIVVLFSPILFSRGVHCRSDVHCDISNLCIEICSTPSMWSALLHAGILDKMRLCPFCPGSVLK